MSSQQFPFRQSEEDHSHPEQREHFTLAAHDRTSHENFGHVKKAGDTMTGNLNFDDDMALIIDFGSITGEKLSLWGTSYGIGVESSTMAFKTGRMFRFTNTEAGYTGGAGMQNTGLEYDADNDRLRAGMWITSFSSSSNVDHIHHNDSSNTWHFVSDAGFGATGNSGLRAGSITAPGTSSISGLTLGAITNGYRISAHSNLAVVEFIRDGTSDRLHLDANDVLTLGGGSQTGHDPSVFSQAIANDTTSGSGNLFIGAGGGMSRATSSIRYKPDWEWLEDAADIELPDPIVWSVTEEDQLPTGQRIVGLGAEHVDEVFPEAAYRGPDGQVESIHEKSIQAVLVAKVKRLEEIVL